MPKESKCFLHLKKKIDSLRTILERKNGKNVKNLHANQLSLEMRLLHNIDNRIFFSKTGCFNWVTKRDVVFMYYMIKGQPINLPFLMIS